MASNKESLEEEFPPSPCYQNTYKQIKVNVRRQDSKIRMMIPLHEAYENFLKSHYPSDDKMITIPFHFEFDKRKLQETEGIMSLDRSYYADYKKKDGGRFKQWMRTGRGLLTEYNVFRKLETVFGNQQCLLVGGFQEKQILKILKEELERDLKKRKETDNSLDLEFTELEHFYYSSLYENYQDLQNEVQIWLASLTEKVTLETLNENINCMTRKPGFQLLSKKNQMEYENNLLKIFETKMKNRSKPYYEKAEIGNCFLRFLLNKCQENNEYDFMLFLPSCGSVLQVEVKSCQAIDKLQQKYEESQQQLQKGKSFLRKLHRILGFDVQHWTHVGVSCFPEVPSRAVFHGICSESDQRNILTMQEMEDQDNVWLLEIEKLMHGPSALFCYKDFASLLAGSLYVSSVEETLFDKRQQQLENVQNTITRMGDINMASLLSPKAEAESDIMFSKLKQKPLGSLTNIIFWNQLQLDSLYTIKRNSHTVIMGDYGTGKTILLDSIARNLKDSGKNVTVISALDHEGHGKKTDDILDIIFRRKYDNIGITFFSIAELRSIEGGKGEKKSTCRLIQEQCKILGQDLSSVLIIDELHISDDDNYYLVENEEDERSELAEFLQFLRENFERSVIVCSSSSVTDGTNLLNRSRTKPTEVIQSSGFEIVTLDKIMRNTSSITSSVIPENVNSYRLFSSAVTPSIVCGQCSTIAGCKPIAVIYNQSNDGGIDYGVLGQCVKRYLDENPHIKDTRLAILCDTKISVRKLKPEICSFFPDIKCYDANIDMFNFNFDTKHMTVKADYGSTSDTYINNNVEDVISWLENGGTLLTHSHVFRGCEAESVIVILKSWDIGGDITPRSAATRGVANLCIITSNEMLQLDVMKTQFDVIETTFNSKTTGLIKRMEFTEI